MKCFFFKVLLFCDTILEFVVYSWKPYCLIITTTTTTTTNNIIIIIISVVSSSNFDNSQ